MLGAITACRPRAATRLYVHHFRRSQPLSHSVETRVFETQCAMERPAAADSCLHVVVLLVEHIVPFADSEPDLHQPA